MSKYRLLALSGVLGMCCVLSGCDSIRDLLGEPRTVPDGAKVDFSNRHAPVLNPGGSGTPVGDTDPQDFTTPAARHVPVENAAESSRSAVMPPAPGAPVAKVAASDYPPLSSVPPTPVYSTTAQRAADFNSLNAARDASEAQRQQLMNNQSATVMTSPQTGQLVDNPADAVAPASASVPAPAQPPSFDAVASAPAAASVPAAPQAAPPPPPAASNDTGFNAWLHHLFTSGSSHPSAAPASAQPSNTPAARAVPSENPQAYAPDAPAPASSHIPSVQAAPVENTPPSAAVPSEAPAPAPRDLMATSAVPPAPPADAMPAASVAEEPIHLHPPTDAPAEVSVPDAPPLAAAANAPVTLSAPALSGSQQHYLGDSRYAARRMQPIPADENVDY